MASLIPQSLKGALTGDYGYAHDQTPIMSGRVAVITGGSNGIGLSLARTLYTHGMELYILSSQADVQKQAKAYITTGDLASAPEDYAVAFYNDQSKDHSGTLGEHAASVKPGSVEFIQVDLSDLKRVAQVAKDLVGRLDRLDLFVGNAGIGVNEFSLTADGYDKHTTVNCWSHQLLLSHLLPLMRKTAQRPSTDVRIVLQSSELHRATTGGPSTIVGGRAFTDETEFKESIGPNAAYARTKLGDILLVKSLVKNKLQDTNILAFTTHPGAVRTGQQEQLPQAYGEVIGNALKSVVKPFMRYPDQGSLCILWASVDPALRTDKAFESGSYFTGPKEHGMESGEASDETLRENFWNISQQIITKIVSKEQMGGY